MRGIVLAALCAAPACVAEEPGVIRAQWDLKELATGGSTACPVGFDTTAVHVMPIDLGGDRVGNGFIDLFPCGAFDGRADYAPGRYEVFLEIATPTLSSRYASSLTTLVDLTASDATFFHTILVDGGYYATEWALRNVTTNQNVTCATSSVAKIEVTAAIAGGSEAKTETFDCTTSAVLSMGLLQGAYTISASAYDASMNYLGTSNQVAQNINAPNKITDLGVITIPISIE
jgi:hypothetical protein